LTATTETTDTTTIKTRAAEEFADRMVGIFNYSALGLLLSIGYQAGLFETMANLAPASSSEIAAAAGLQSVTSGSGWAM
jgi:hypothetical protein